MLDFVEVMYLQTERIIMISNTFNLMTIKDFAHEIKRATSTVYDWKNKGSVPIDCFKQVAGTWYVKVDKMKAFLAV